MIGIRGRRKSCVTNSGIKYLNIGEKIEHESVVEEMDVGLLYRHKR